LVIFRLNRVIYLETKCPRFLLMSNRAISSAINKRTNAPQQNNIPPPGRGQGQGQGYPSGRPGQQQQFQQQQQQQQQQPQQPPKMSVSDAIGLISLRLGRVETVIQQLPPLDQIGMDSTGENIGENMRVVDEAVFTNIVTRLESLEKKTSNPVQTTNNSQLTSVFARLDKLENTPSLTPSLTQIQDIDELKHSIDILKAEMVQTKELLLSLQSFTMQTNQKLVNLVLNDGDGNDEESVGEKINAEEKLQDDGVESEDVDDEIASQLINLKTFVESSI